MVLCAGDKRVTRSTGRPASADEARAATGFAIGGIPPLGHDVRASDDRRRVAPPLLPCLVRRRYAARGVRDRRRRAARGAPRRARRAGLAEVARVGHRCQAGEALADVDSRVAVDQRLPREERDVVGRPERDHGVRVPAGAAPSARPRSRAGPRSRSHAASRGGGRARRAPMPKADGALGEATRASAGTRRRAFSSSSSSP